MKLGLREANQHFSKAMKAVRAGEEVVLTERGKPIAVIMPFRTGSSLESILERLAQAGFIRIAEEKGPIPPARPVVAKGKPISRFLAEEREER